MKCTDVLLLLHRTHQLRTPVQYMLRCAAIAASHTPAQDPSTIYVKMRCYQCILSLQLQYINITQVPSILNPQICKHFKDGLLLHPFTITPTYWWYSRTSVIQISIIHTLGYPNAILNFNILEDNLFSETPSHDWNACVILDLLGLLYHSTLGRKTY